jgi:hypothetical protein
LCHAAGRLSRSSVTQTSLHLRLPSVSPDHPTKAPPPIQNPTPSRSTSLQSHKQSPASTKRDKRNFRYSTSTTHRSPTSTSQPHLSYSVNSRMSEESMTFKSVSTSGTVSSKASSLFDLDERGRKSILVYKYRSGAKGLEVKTERALCQELDEGISLFTHFVALIWTNASLMDRSGITLHTRHPQAHTARKFPSRHPQRRPTRTLRAGEVRDKAYAQGLGR